MHGARLGVSVHHFDGATKMSVVHSSTMADDLLTGAKQIGAYLGKPPRQVYWLAERRLLPIIKLGGALVARRSALAAHIADLERAALDAGTRR